MQLRKQSEHLCVQFIHDRACQHIHQRISGKSSAFGIGSEGLCASFSRFNSSNRRENITDFALKSFQDHYQDPSISKWDIFHYVYALLHPPQYRAKFADNLKRSLPRIPFAPTKPHADTPTPRHSDTSAFRLFAATGRQLADLHLNYESLDPHPLQYLTSPKIPLSYRVEKMKLSKDKTRLIVNPSLTLAPIPPEVFTYRLGNRSALDWIIDQYQVSTDKRSNITSDPNRPDDDQYIVRLAAQIIHLSLQTMKIVNSLPPLFPSK